MEVDLIIKKLGLDAKQVVRNPIRGLPGFTIEELLFAIVNTESLPSAGQLLGYGEGSVKTGIREVLAPYFPDRSAPFLAAKRNPSWRFTLLSIVQYKHCNSCDKNLPFGCFYSHTGSDSTDLSSECSACHTYRTKLQKLGVKDRTPTWANLDKIRDFYSKCPYGYHVDHIIPLRGKIVSGMHVETNLQYLLAEDNLKKSNKFLT